MSLKNMNFNKFRELLQNLYFMNPNGFQIFILMSICISTLCFFHLIFGPKTTLSDVPEAAIEAATFIPEDHSLIPIKLVNQKAISSLIENFGWIDLYSIKKTDLGFKKGPKIVKKIRILRAPLDPKQFGIIVPNDFVDSILDYGPDYFATLNKNKFYKSELVINRKQRKRVQYEDML
jgi:hypothetical protein